MRVLTSCVVAVLAIGSTLGAQSAPPLPTVVILATGGTIAGVQDAPGTTGRYRAGTLTAEQIVASVPELPKVARIETEQFSNVPSTLIGPPQWIALARRVEEILRSRRDVAGVVITHGTDRLEETAFFLYLTVRSEKPVVMVGAQRPATGLSADGPYNLLGAVRVAASPAAVGKGVVVVMDDRIISAREVRKLYQRIGGFSGGEMGVLGVVTANEPAFFFAPTRRRGARSEFDVSTIESLPDVPLTMSYPGGTGPAFTFAPAGVVVATTGFTREEGAAYRTLRREGTVVVTAFPSGDNVNRPAAPRDIAGDTLTPPVTAADSIQRAEALAPPTVVVQHLTPAKARILLMLALTKTRDPREVQRFFSEY